MIQEITDNLVTINDTISLAVSDLILSNKSNSPSGAGRDIWAVFGPLLTGILGAAIALWSKSKEIKNMNDNLDLQRQVVEQNRINNENQIKAELVKLQDLSNQYKLSLRKFDFEKISKVLDFTEDKDEKVKMLKSFRGFLQKLDIDSSVGIGDKEGFEEFSIRTIYNNLELIRTNINEIRNQFPHVFTLIQDDLQHTVQCIDEINHHAAEICSYKEANDEDIIEALQRPLLRIQEDLNSILTAMVEEFKSVEKLKKDLISVD